MSLVELKFGALQPSAVRRIEAASEAQLSRWAARVLDAASLEETLVD